MDKVKKKIEKINQVIEKNGRYGYYLIDEGKIKLISKSNNKMELDHDLFMKIARKRKTIGKTVYFIEYYANDKYIKSKIVAGPVHIKIKQYEISPKYQLIEKDNFTNGAVFYTNDDILNNRFHISDVRTLLKKIHDDKIVITNILGINANKILI